MFIFFTKNRLYKVDHRLQMPREEVAFTALQGQKSTPIPKLLGTAEAYFVCHIGPIFQISLVYAFIGCLQSMRLMVLCIKLLLRKDKYTLGGYEYSN